MRKSNKQLTQQLETAMKQYLTLISFYLFCSTALSLSLLLLLPLGGVQGLSQKGRKLSLGEDSFFGEEDDDEDDGNSADSDFDEDFFDFDFEEEGSDGGDCLPDDITCLNRTVAIPEEPKFHDALLSRILSQSWMDFQTKVQEDSSLYGVLIDPLDIDALVEKPVEVNQASASYRANLTMWDIQMYGLSRVNLTEVSVDRNENLSLIHI